MKRLHIHVSVDDVEQSVRFYKTLFGGEPAVLKPDYAKWMLEDPRVNFAISKRGGPSGVQHLGIQVEDEAELADVFGRMERANGPILEEKGTTCCYASSDKQWISDPQGVAWETFLTRGETTVYGQGGAIDRLAAVAATEKLAACCGPAAAELPAAPVTVKSSCCGPKA